MLQQEGVGTDRWPAVAWGHRNLYRVANSCLAEQMAPSMAVRSEVPASRGMQVGLGCQECHEGAKGKALTHMVWLVVWAVYALMSGPHCPHLQMEVKLLNGYFTKSSASGPLHELF